MFYFPVKENKDAYKNKKNLTQIFGSGTSKIFDEIFVKAVSRFTARIFLHSAHIVIWRGFVGCDFRVPR